MKKKKIRIIVMFLLFVFLTGSYSNLTKAESNSYKYFYFGKYVQNVVRNKKLKDELGKQEFTNGMTVYNGTKFAKKNMNYDGYYSYIFFQEEPIKWRVLKEDNESYWLMSERIIEQKQLSSGLIEKWSDATVRKWLNEDFIDIAFSDEKNDLIATSISSKTVNWDDINLSGNANADEIDITNDKVWLLSQEEVLDSSYGFSDNESRIAYATDYVDLYNNSQKWHLRGNPYYFYGLAHMATMNQDGSIHQQGGVADTNNCATNQFGIRPIIRVKKDSEYLYEENPSVASIEKAKKIEFVGNKYENKYKNKYETGTPEGSITIEIDENDFSESSLNYNHNLAMYGIAMSTMMYNSGEKGKKNIYDALEKLGYDNVYSKLTYGEGYTGNESPVVIASKEVNLDGEKTALIGVYIRGTYQQEWINNFEVGKYSYGSDHQGFAGAAKTIDEKLRDFISENISADAKLKIFITGHSRGAAVANILGSRLNDSLTASKNIFVYTYATPNTTSIRKSTREGFRYKNIYNIVNPEDFVTKVVPSKWGYGRYGTTYVLPSSTCEKRSNNGTCGRYDEYLIKLQKKYYEANPEEELTYQPYENGMSDVSNYVNNVTQEVANLEEYYNKNIGSKTHNPNYGTLRHLFIGVLAYSCCQKYQSQGTRNAILALNKNNWGEIGQQTVAFFLKNHTDVVKDMDILQPRFDWAHKAETYYGALMDNISEEYLIEKKKSLKGIVNCPVDVTIKDSEGNVVGNIKNNQVTDQIDDSVYMEVNGDSKIFYLPNDGSSYNIELEGNDNGTMDYSLAEVDLDTWEISRTVYRSVPIEKDKILNQSMEFENDELVISELKKEDDSVIESYGEYSIDSLGELSVKVTVEGVGFADSLSSLSPGDYVNLKATTDENNEFLGWYSSKGELLSEEDEYNFTIFEDDEYVAKFTNNVVDVERIEFENSVIQANVGDCINNEVNVFPQNATDIHLEYTSSNESVVEVGEFGILEAKGEGIACVTAKSSDEKVVESFYVGVGDFIEIGKETLLPVTEDTRTYGKIAFGIFSPDENVLYDFGISEGAYIRLYDIDSHAVNEKELKKDELYSVYINLRDDYSEETFSINVQEKELDDVSIDYEQSKKIFNSYDEIKTDDIVFNAYFSDGTQKSITDFSIEKYSDENEEYGDVRIVLKTKIGEMEYSDTMHIMIIPEYEIINSSIDLSSINSYYDYDQDERYYFIKFVPDEDSYYQFETTWDLSYSFKIVDPKNNYNYSYERGENWYAEFLNEGCEYYLRILCDEYLYDDTINNGSITIRKIEYTDVEFENKKVSMNVGDIQKLAVIITPNSSMAKIFYYLSYGSDSEVIYLDNDGNVTAKSVGKVNVCVETSTGSSDQCEIVVTSDDPNNNNPNIDNNDQNGSGGRDGNSSNNGNTNTNNNNQNSNDGGSKNNDTNAIWTPKPIVTTGSPTTTQQPSTSIEQGKPTQSTNKQNQSTQTPNISTTSQKDTTYSTQIVKKVKKLSVKNNKSKSITIKWKWQSAADGYQVQIATNKYFTKGKKTKTIRSGYTDSLTWKGLKQGKTYYVRVRAYEDGFFSDIYGSWSAVKKIKIKN